MTSQSTDVRARPNGRAMMVPIGAEMCFATVEGMITAIVQYMSTDDGIVPWGFALDETAQNALPSASPVDDQFVELESTGNLVSLHSVMDAGNGFLRVDDNRRGHNWSYFVRLGNERQDGVSFISGAVYHWFDNKVVEHEFPRLENFEDVVALTTNPGARIITDYSASLAMKVRDDAEVVAELGDLNGAIVVWDRGALQRNARANMTHN